MQERSDQQNCQRAPLLNRSHSFLGILFSKFFSFFTYSEMSVLHPVLTINWQNSACHSFFHWWGIFHYQEIEDLEKQRVVVWKTSNSDQSRIFCPSFLASWHQTVNSLLLTQVHCVPTNHTSKSTHGLETKSKKLYWLHLQRQNFSQKHLVRHHLSFGMTSISTCWLQGWTSSMTPLKLPEVHMQNAYPNWW